METTLVLLKPSCVQRQLIGEVLNRLSVAVFVSQV